MSSLEHISLSGQILVDIILVETDLFDLDPSLFDLDRGSTVIIIVMSHSGWCCVHKVWIGPFASYQH